MKQTILAFLVVLLGAGPAWTMVSRGNGPFTITWELTPKRTIEGRVYNEYLNPMMRIRLLVEALDASDRVVDQTFGDVFGVVGPLSDRYFVGVEAAARRSLPDERRVVHEPRGRRRRPQRQITPRRRRGANGSDSHARNTSL